MLDQLPNCIVIDGEQAVDFVDLVGQLCFLHFELAFCQSNSFPAAVPIKSQFFPFQFFNDHLIDTLVLEPPPKPFK